MTRRTLATLALLLTPYLAVVPAFAQDGPADAVALWQEDPATVFDASEVDISDFRWIARSLVVFADSPVQPDFVTQMELISEDAQGLVRRDVVVVTDTDPSAQSDLRRELRPRGFMIALIGKDGEVKLRKPRSRSVREISRSIDKMPMRQQEIRNGG